LHGYQVVKVQTFAGNLLPISGLVSTQRFALFTHIKPFSSHLSSFAPFAVACGKPKRLRYLKLITSCNN
ncbi:hypothetical protein, partial [Nostoc sp.]|uniref:hypothetical protein n=1 Tax=Nostoc sp. TaxID=1180 RepID=UPI002FF7DF14